MPQPLTPMLETAVPSATEHSSSDDKTTVFSLADSQPEAASTIVFPRPTEPTPVPRESLWTEHEKEDELGAFPHTKTMSSDMPLIRLGI